MPTDSAKSNEGGGKLPHALLTVYRQMAEHYEFLTHVRSGRGYVAYEVLAEEWSWPAGVRAEGCTPRAGLRVSTRGARRDDCRPAIPIRRRAGNRSRRCGRARGSCQPRPAIGVGVAGDVGSPTRSQGPVGRRRRYPPAGRRRRSDALTAGVPTRPAGVGGLEVCHAWRRASGPPS